LYLLLFFLIFVNKVDETYSSCYYCHENWYAKAATKLLALHDGAKASNETRSKPFEGTSHACLLYFRCTYWFVIGSKAATNDSINPGADYKENWEWCQLLSDEYYQNDVLIVAGDSTIHCAITVETSYSFALSNTLCRQIESLLSCTKIKV